MSTVDLVFEEHRPTLERLAYRMLGSWADADDVLQEAYLRWTRADRSNVESPRAFLHSIVSRLCIDQRRVIDARKETYIGPWLPEPAIETSASPEQAVERTESISFALLTVLESLSPVERAAYLLRQMFDYDYAEIARLIGKSEVNCRQLVRRAEEHIHQRRPKFEAPIDQAERVTGAFLQACTTGDLNGLVQLLAADAVAYSDGGGKATAARVPVVGADRVAKFFVGITKKLPPGTELRLVRVNGRPGVMVIESEKVHNVMTLDVVDDKIVAVYVIRNPEKLARAPK